MNTIWKIDAWIMARHQWVADRIYSRAGLSPYEIAAHMFGAVCVCNMAYHGIRFSATSPGIESLYIFMAVMSVIVPAIWFWLALLRHNEYARTKLTPFQPPADDYFRMSFLVLWVIGLVPGIIDISDKPYRLFSELALTFYTIGFYFYGCNAPTFIERKEHKLVEVGA